MARTGFGRKNSTPIANGVASSSQTRHAEPARPAVAVAPAAAANTPAATSSNATKPSLDLVRQKAFELYQARAKSGRPGDSTTDWLEAERLVKTESARSPHLSR